MSFPKTINRVIVPPIKCQGIKTKLVPFIAENIQWNGAGRWIEPFMGSGVVAFNLRPENALLADSNPHIIQLYQAIQQGTLTPSKVRNHLEQEGKILLDQGGDHYYAIRERFNEQPNSLDFLFLNRSCFNGMMRFNQRGKFNVPFCRKPERFRPAYITKIVNQVKAIRDVIRDRAWEFQVSDWRVTLDQAQDDDFIYLDPPYIGRYADYYNQWSDDEAEDLATVVKNLSGGYAVSMWKENRHRKNTHIDQAWKGTVERSMTHFYHLGATEDLRNAMEEALLIKPDYAASISEKSSIAMQLDLFE